MKGYVYEKCLHRKYYLDWNNYNIYNFINNRQKDKRNGQKRSKKNDTLTCIMINKQN